MTIDKARKPYYFPMGIADPIEKIGFIINQNEGIDAIDLVNGKKIWTTDTPCYPLIAYDHQLAALKVAKDGTNSISVIVFDKWGKILKVSESLQLQEWVDACNINSKDFEIDNWLRGNELYISWCVHTSYKGGANPSHEILELYKRDSEGVIHICLNTGKAEMLSPEDKLYKRTSVDYRNLTSAPYHMGSSLQLKPWAINNKVFALSIEETGLRNGLYLNVFNLHTKQIESSIELTKEKLVIPSVSKDGRYLFIPIESIQKKSNVEVRIWSIFSIEKRKYITQLGCEDNIQEICVLEPGLYYISTIINESTIRNILKARDMKTGKLMWEILLREQYNLRPPQLLK